MNNQTNEGVAIKKVTNVFSKKILAKRALREIKLLQHFRGHRNVRRSTLCHVETARLGVIDSGVGTYRGKKPSRLTEVTTDHLLV